MYLMLFGTKQYQLSRELQKLKKESTELLLKLSQIQIKHERCLKLIKNAEKEIILMFPTINAFNRQERMGVFELSKGPDIKLRILVLHINPLIRNYKT